LYIFKKKKTLFEKIINIISFKNKKNGNKI
jgi:hypothetical protein